MWFYVQKILVAYQIQDAVIHNQPRGNFSDLYPRWLGTKELLLHQRDPYSAEITREIQQGYYGRALDPAQPADPKDEQRFAYPLYVIFILAPFIHLSFHTVQIIWFWMLLSSTAAGILFWISSMRWHPSKWTTAAIVILTIGSFAAVQALKLQQLTLLVAGLLAVVCFLLAKTHYGFAGIVLALCTIKPQLAILPVACLLLWASGDWRTRKRFARTFAGMMALLFIAAQLVFPGWISSFLKGLSAYREYTGGAESSLEVLLTPLLGKVVAAVIAIAVLIICWCWRKAEAGSAQFTLLVSLVLAVTIAAVAKVAPYDHVLLLPAIFFMLQHWVPFKNITVSSRALIAVTTLMLIWPWLASLTLAIFSLFLPKEIILRGWMVPLYPSIGLPPAIMVLLIPRIISQWSSPALYRTPQ